MHGNAQFAEDLNPIAAQSFELSRRLCGDCVNFHALWPYLRISRFASATESGRVALEQLLIGLFEQGHRKIMLAGAADTGVPALVARAAAGHSIDMMVLDRCDTPLELNKTFFQNRSFPIRTMKCELAELEARAEFDVIVAHSVLQWIDAGRRRDVLFRLGRALRPVGWLLHVYNAGQRMSAQMLPGYRESYGQWVCEQLDRDGVPLPESRDAFRKRLEAFALERQSIEGTFQSADEVDALMETAGLRVTKRIEVEVRLADPMASLASKVARRRFISVAEPK